MLQHYKRTLLRLDNQDLFRKKVIMTASMLYVLVFFSFILIQSNILKLSKNQTTIFANTMDLLALFLCLAVLLTSLYNVFYLEKEKGKIYDRLKDIEQPYKARKQEIKSSSTKFADFCDRHGNKVDMLGSIFTTVMQAVVILSMTLPGIFDHSEIPRGTVFNLQGIVDTAGNIFFVLAAAMFLCSYLIRYNKSKEKEAIKNRFDKKSFILYSLFFGCLLVCAGKVLLSFETRGGPMYTGSVGPLGVDILPLGLMIRAVGMLIFCIGYAVLLSTHINENRKLENEVMSLSDSCESSTCSESDCSSEFKQCKVECGYGSQEKLVQ
ncbi:MAG: hypothetical protein ACTJLM_02660 [Ehrlichia sp.]